VLSHEGWQRLPELVPQLVRDVVAGTGAEVEIDYMRGVPPVVNHRETTAVLEAAARAALGAGRLSEAELSMGGEDFAFYLEHVPGTMFRLGVGRADATEPMDIHQSSFDVDESAIAAGVRFMVHTAIAALTTAA
jgi:amidohydrolase